MPYYKNCLHEMDEKTSTCPKCGNTTTKGVYQDGEIAFPREHVDYEQGKYQDLFLAEFQKKLTQFEEE